MSTSGISFTAKYIASLVISVSSWCHYNSVGGITQCHFTIFHVTSVSVVHVTAESVPPQ